MKKETREGILHILRNIAQRGRINGDFRVRQEDLDAIWAIVTKENGNERPN